MELISAISPDTTFCGMPLKDVIQVAWGKKSVAQCERENPGLIPTYLELAVKMFMKVYELGPVKGDEFGWPHAYKNAGLEDFLSEHQCDWTFDMDRAQYNATCGLKILSHDLKSPKDVAHYNQAHWSHHTNTNCGRGVEFPHGHRWVMGIEIYEDRPEGVSIKCHGRSDQ